MDALQLLRTRRSVKAANLQAPAPSAAQLETIFEIAARVPDHGKLAPWRFKILHAAGQKKLGTLCAELFMKENAEQATEKHYAFEAERFTRAPLVVAVLYTPIRGKIPLWEQELSAGAVCMNMLHAAHALGFAGQWLTEWPAYRREVCEALGGGEDDKIAGFIYIGTPSEAPDERPRPNINDIATVWE